MVREKIKRLEKKKKGNMLQEKSCKKKTISKRKKATVQETGNHQYRIVDYFLRKAKCYLNKNSNQDI